MTDPLPPARSLVTPRVAGVALIIASALVGVASGALIGAPPWSIGGALALTAATVGVGVGALWLARRSWADRTWPPGGRARDPREQGRRAAIVAAVMLLLPVPAGLSVLVSAAMSGELDGGRAVLIGILCIVYTAGGVAIIVSARSSRRRIAVADEDERPADTPLDTDGDGWVVLRVRARWWFGIAAAAPGMIVFLVLPMQFMFTTLQSPVLFAVVVVVLLGAVGWLVVVIRRTNAAVAINAAQQLLRIGARRSPWGEITQAMLLAVPATPGPDRTLTLALHGDGIRARIPLRHRGALVLTQAETDLISEVVAHSAIEMPRDKDDPKGRFSKALYPANLTKAEAVAMIASPPSADEALPYPSM